MVIFEIFSIANICLDNIVENGLLKVCAISNEPPNPLPFPRPLCQADSHAQILQSWKNPALMNICSQKSASIQPSRVCGGAHRPRGAHSCNFASIVSLLTCLFVPLWYRQFLRKVWFTSQPASRERASQSLPKNSQK